MSNQHIIQKQFVEVIANNVGDGFSLQKDVENVCKLKLIPHLGLLLDKYGSTDEVIQIDKLFIEVDSVSLSEFENVLVEKVLRKIEDALREQVSAGSVKTNQPASSIYKREIELLVFYLQKGYLPWWSSVKNTNEWQQKLDHLLSPGNPEVEWMILRVAFKEDSVRERLLAEFSEKQFWLIVDRVSPVDYKILTSDLATLHQHIRLGHSQTAFKDLILKSIAEESGVNLLSTSIVYHISQEVKEVPKLFTISPDLVKTLKNKELQRMLAQLKAGSVSALSMADKKFKVLEKDALKHDQQSENKSALHTGLDTSDEKIFTSSRDRSLQEEIYIGDSGLTIIAPYLTLFFKNLQLVDKDKINDIPKALGLLHYITYGDDDYAGFECVLSKILCGVDLSAVVKKVVIAKTDKAAADELLTAVIGHWQALKKTSVSALQTSFLQREGRLSFRNNEWNLRVHNESYDLLLSHLPWNINIIKLPWMNHLLKVDWM